MAMKAKNPIQSLETTIQIVEELKEAEQAGLTELAQRLDMNKGTVHHHMTTLQQHGFIVKTDGQYRIGLRCLEFGAHIRSRMNVYKVGKPEIDSLAEETGEIANLMVEENGRGIYIYTTKGEKAISLDTKVGTRQYLHTSALGKSIFAHLPEERVEEIIDTHGLPAKTENTVTTRDELESELERIREEDIAFDGEERAEGVRCVAAPIYNKNNKILGAVSVSGPASRIKGDVFKEEIPEQVHNTATVIGINVSYD
ncbi:IclR family transcriptional regulator [Natronorubrum sp. FCH18a]|uniref:IclR family transcriptional regulator n=1 Tax=Natronorubrum sp. FCH18a TaxID=3447018 RepID=UPI003F5100DF